MKLELTYLASALLLVLPACDRGDTDIGDLENSTESSTGSPETGDETGGESGGESGETTGACAGEGENCENGCCDGFGCNFATVCQACDPAGSYRKVDGAGCCEGLETTPGEICFDATCDGDTCPEGIEQCAPLQDQDYQDYHLDCAPEACLASRQLVLDGGTLECTGPGGGDDCAASGEFLQNYRYETDGLLLTLRFDNVVLEDYSTESFNENLDGVAGQLTVPDATVPVIAFVETGTVSDLVYADGRLQFTISVPLDNPFAIIESDADDCISDDIAGICSCFYGDLGTYDIVVDLAVEAP